MTDIKICGMTNIGDAINAVQCGADALGFIFYPKSPRYVTPEAVKGIINKLPRDVCTVGVFVNNAVKEIKGIMEFCRLDFIQLHGNESPKYCQEFSGSRVIKAISKRMPDISDYSVSAILIDAFHPELYGGIGKKSDWNFAVEVKDYYPLILSGGLNLENIEEALSVVSPNAVDINSGVEKSPGKKDPEKVRKIIEIVTHTENITKEKVFEK